MKRKYEKQKKIKIKKLVPNSGHLEFNKTTIITIITIKRRYSY